MVEAHGALAEAWEGGGGAGAALATEELRGSCSSNGRSRTASAPRFGGECQVSVAEGCFGTQGGKRRLAAPCAAFIYSQLHEL